MSTDTPGPGHNRPKKTVELDQDLLEFVEENCESNIRLAMNLIDPCGPFPEMKMEKVRKIVEMVEKFRKIVEMVEKFKRLREALREAR